MSHPSRTELLETVEPDFEKARLTDDVPTLTKIIDFLLGQGFDVWAHDLYMLLNKDVQDLIKLESVEEVRLNDLAGVL